MPNSKVTSSLLSEFFADRMNEEFTLPPITAMFVMLCCLYYSGPDASADDSEEAEKVGNMSFISWLYGICFMYVQ